MSDKRQENQLMLAFAEEYRGEAPNGLIQQAVVQVLQGGWPTN